MGCDEIRELIPAYIGGDADANECIAVEAHLVLCAECRTEAARFKESREALLELREGEVPAGTFERMWKQVRAVAVPAKSPRRLDWILRVAAVLVMGIAVGYIASSSRPMPVPQAPSLGVEKVPEVGGGVQPIEGPVRRAGERGEPAEDPGLRSLFEPRLHRTPRARLDGNHYLPRVEAILSSDDVDF